MDKAKEILSKHWECDVDELQLNMTLNPDVNRIKDAMQEYAEQYHKSQLIKAWREEEPYAIDEFLKNIIRK